MVNPMGDFERVEQKMAQLEQFVHAERKYQMLMKQSCHGKILLLALKRVETNKGSHGVDGMSVKFLRRHLYENWLINPRLL